MSDRTHSYTVQISWTGNRGVGTANYRAYDRSHVIDGPGKRVIDGSSDPSFRGDPGRWNPEELLVASLAACHQLWYLHLCAVGGIAVLSYEDRASGQMIETADGSGHFDAVVLRPRVGIRPGDDLDRARALHEVAHEKCFIANSVNFQVSCEPEIYFAA